MDDRYRTPANVRENRRGSIAQLNLHELLAETRTSEIAIRETSIKAETEAHEGVYDGYHLKHDSPAQH
jgi:hypothetical protein